MAKLALCLLLVASGGALGFGAISDPAEKMVQEAEETMMLQVGAGQKAPHPTTGLSFWSGVSAVDQKTDGAKVDGEVDGATRRAKAAKHAAKQMGEKGGTDDESGTDAMSRSRSAIWQRSLRYMEGKAGYGAIEGLPKRCQVPLCDNTKNCTGLTCCNTQMFEAVAAITDFMDRKKMKYVLILGTLLGAMRDNDIIYHTNDIDIGIDYDDRFILFNQTEIPWSFWGWGYMRGCENHHPGFPGNYGPVFDINNKDNPTQKAWQNVRTTGDDLGGKHNGGAYHIDFNHVPEYLDNKQLEQVKIRGKWFKAPRGSERLLTRWYGDWKKDSMEHAQNMGDEIMNPKRKPKT